jgi:hypothetical protein
MKQETMRKISKIMEEQQQTLTDRLEFKPQLMKQK